jgi:hypothetical protein
MSLYSVSYTSDRSDRDDTHISRYLQQLRAQRVRFPVWILNSRETLWEIRDDLLDHLDKNDRLMIADVTDVPFAWHNLKTQSVRFRK